MWLINIMFSIEYLFVYDKEILDYGVMWICFFIIVIRLLRILILIYYKYFIYYDIYIKLYIFEFIVG